MFTARPRANEIDFRADSSDIEFCVFDYKKSSSWDVVLLTIFTAILTLWLSTTSVLSDTVVQTTLQHCYDYQITSCDYRVPQHKSLRAKYSRLAYTLQRFKRFSVGDLLRCMQRRI